MSITLDQVTKHYGGVPVVNDVSLDIGDGEFFVLLGPSGSGKSTLLRAIAGLSGVDHGRIALHGRDVTHVAARKRGVGLVFQNYALFRHMTVAENIEFALRVRHMRARARRQRRQELLRLVALEGLDERLPAQLSGGQQQRVAVARALAHKPEVLLLDEPFGALDAKIREELRRTIRQVQRELGITTVLVTHDQEEALSLADVVAVLRDGRIVQQAAPAELYERPVDERLARFLGAVNVVAAQFEDGVARTPLGTLELGRAPANGDAHAGPAPRTGIVMVRPEQLDVHPCAWDGGGAGAPAGLRGRIEQCRYYGHDALLHIRPDQDGGAELLLARVHGGHALPVGTAVNVAAHGPVAPLERAPAPPY
jgi:ABC-type Fe3+/spermidine/putrescine transport system ATPase subunit